MIAVSVRLCHYTPAKFGWVWQIYEGPDLQVYMLIDNGEGQGKSVRLQEAGQELITICAQLHRVAHGARRLCSSIGDHLSLLRNALQVIKLL